MSVSNWPARRTPSAVSSGGRKSPVAGTRQPRLRHVARRTLSGAHPLPETFLRVDDPLRPLAFLAITRTAGRHRRVQRQIWAEAA
ncbi:MAG TPA: hypothetical protein VGF67_13135 [Ktedonobacteraceae bacterium]